jgi:uncharacterized protein (TIGR03083 family)
MTRVDWAYEYAQTRARVRAVLEGADAAGDGLTVVPACPDWTVHDVLAHVTGLACALGAGEGPSGDTQSWIDALVGARRHSSIGELLDEWDAAAGGIDEFFVRSGAGGGQLVYDVVAHEHDIRHALGRPGARDSSGVVASADAMTALLARDLAAHALPAVRITSGGRTWDAGTGEPELAIELDPFELIRVFGARRSEAQLRRLAWQGDLDRYLPGLRHFPLPLDDLVE